VYPLQTATQLIWKSLCLHRRTAFPTTPANGAHILHPVSHLETLLKISRPTCRMGRYTDSREICPYMVVVEGSYNPSRSGPDSDGHLQGALAYFLFLPTGPRTLSEKTAKHVDFEHLPLSYISARLRFHSTAPRSFKHITTGTTIQILPSSLSVSPLRYPHDWRASASSMAFLPA